MATIKQEGSDEVIARVYDLSCNQLIYLLECYRGTSSRCVTMGTLYEDISFLIRIGLLKQVANGIKGSLMAFYDVTEEGHRYINNILTVTIEVD